MLAVGMLAGVRKAGWFTLSLSLACFGHALAEPPSAALTSSSLRGTSASLARIKLDASGKPAYLARFSDGPRNVPTPRGTAKARADRLGLGSAETVRPLLWSRPSEELLGEVGGEAPRDLLWPVVSGRWGRGFGYTRTARPELRHNGVDIGAKQGAIVRAAADGLVVYSDNGLLGYGNCVIVLHANGWLTLYAHNLRNTVQPGWRVKRGERIGLLGQTGYAWGPHLHFELRDNGKLRNPKPLFAGYRSDEVNGPLVELEPDALLGDTHPHVEDIVEAQAEPKTSPTPTPSTTPDPLPSAEAVLRGAPSPEQLALATGRTFRTLLWPVKGGAVAARRRSTLDIQAEPGSGVRAAADGVVVHSGDGLRGYGNVVVVLHPGGWVTVYDGTAEIAVRRGDQVLRGQWIARVGGEADRTQARLSFEWLADGKRQDPRAVLTGVP
jgi:murein DD-endopeptidase MepM/ murein hydrolase activator NlpD